MKQIMLTEEEEEKKMKLCTNIKRNCQLLFKLCDLV